MLTTAAVFIGSDETPCSLTMWPRKESCFLLNSLVTVAPADQSFVMLCGVCHHVPAEGPAAKTNKVCVDESFYGIGWSAPTAAFSTVATSCLCTRSHDRN